MKIISQSAKWSKEVDCPHCQAKLEIFEEDMTAVNTAVAYAGETKELEVGVRCGVCHTFFEVKHIPAGIYNHAIEVWDKAQSRY